jgi:putative membrane protein
MVMIILFSRHCLAFNTNDKTPITTPNKFPLLCRHQYFKNLILMRIIVRWCINALALLAVAYLYSGVQVDGIMAALIAALVLGLANAIIRPVLILLTLPVTLLTMGLFIFVINAFLFWFVAEVVSGFNVAGFMAALIGSLMYSVITLIVNAIVTDKKK